MAARRKRQRTWSLRTQVSLCIVLVGTSCLLAFITPSTASRSINAISESSLRDGVQLPSKSNSSSLLVNAVANENEVASAGVSVGPVNGTRASDESIQASVNGYSDFVHSLAERETAFYMAVASGILDITADPHAAMARAGLAVDNAYVVSSAVYASEDRTMHAALSYAGVGISGAATAIMGYEAAYRSAQMPQVIPAADAPGW